MACYYPITAYRPKTGDSNPRGEGQLVFSAHAGQQDSQLEIACGRCIGCRLEKSREWALRCVHESQSYQDNAFITLTYDEEHLPPDGGLHVEHFQKFMKRLRRQNGKIRFYMAGEYGEDKTQPTGLGRPHWHAILFGYKPDDLELFTIQNELPIYTSAKLSKIWTAGHHTVQDVNETSAAYVARYTTKKILGPDAEDHYTKINYQTGELVPVRPEFSTQSRNPGIGASWFSRNRRDLRKGFVTHKGEKRPVPRYYRKLYKAIDDDTWSTTAIEMGLRINPDDPHKTQERLRVREEAQKLKAKRLKRQL